VTTTPIRILNVLSYYVPHISGLTEAVRLTSERLAADHEFDITVLTMRHKRELPARENIAGVSVVRATPLVNLHKGFLSVDFLGQYRDLVRHTDLVHLHVPMLEAGVLAFLTPRSVPLIASWYCDLAPSARWSVVDRLAIAAVQRSCAACCRRAERVCVLSEDYAAGSALLQPFSDKLEVVYPPDNASESLRPRSPARDGRAPRIGFLGRFVEEKGIDVLLKAAPKVLRRFPAAQFVLAGDYQHVAGGSEYERLKQQIDALGERVVLPGTLPHDELFDFYRSLDVFVLPSVNAYEAFGIVQVEAMKAGVPVVASDLRGVRVPVQTTGNGVLAPPGDAEQLASAIVSVLECADRYVPAEVASRAWKHFSTAASAETLANLYRRFTTATKSLAAR